VNARAVVPIPGVGGHPPGVMLVLSENWTMTPPRDLRALVQLAVDAEHAGVDTVMLSEHVTLGSQADEHGRPTNPRDYAAPGNQDPAMPWPDSIVLAAAVASATTRIRIALAALIAPLRHPLLLAKQLASLDLLAEGRIVFQPTVSWHEQEYAALGVPFEERGAILDEELEAMHRVWRDHPASHQGRFFSFEEMYAEPRPYRADGLQMWFGGESLHPAILRRLVRYGHGLHPFGTPTGEELAELRDALRQAGRDPAWFELVGGIRGRFPDGGSTADLDEAMQSIPDQIQQGYTSIAFKPSMFSDDRRDVPTLCRAVVRRVREAAAGRPGAAPRPRHAP
jgi:probable F420-dependent oxidoreductase